MLGGLHNYSICLEKDRKIDLRNFRAPTFFPTITLHKVEVVRRYDISRPKNTTTSLDLCLRSLYPLKAQNVTFSAIMACKWIYMLDGDLTDCSGR